MRGMPTAAVLAVAMLAWGAPVQPAVAKKAPVQITVRDNQFKPRQIVVEGKIVRWTNRGDNRHTVISVRKGLFRRVLDPGEFFRIRFTTAVPGTYKYFCRIHDNMRGKFELEPPARV